MALNLAAPHTWPAAIMPTLVAVSAAASVTAISASMSIVLLCIVILMQSAVNTFNDYYDYVKGTDSAEDNVDESDAVLVYNNIDPKSALRLAIGFLGVAFLLGIYAIVVAGFVPLVIALIGALFVVLYSAGKSPISYLPLGEVVSGVVMGGLIPLAVYKVLTGILDFRMLIVALPTIIGVALIMFTNNTCDLERDIPAGRKTLPILLGRERSRSLYHALLVLWVVLMIVNVAIWYTPGLVIVPFMLLASYPIVKALWGNPLTPERRLQAMPQALTVNVVFGTFYAAALLAASGVAVVL
ncbi:MAG: prenyltransferase [Eggerthellaceae bacterium]|nr:prenyltransferase [Eggerthellaceae bacterium]